MLLAALALRPARIDGTSPATAAASIEEIKNELRPEDRRRFRESIRFIVADTLGRSYGYGSGTAGKDVDREVAARLDGKSARQVIAAYFAPS